MINDQMAVLSVHREKEIELLQMNRRLLNKRRHSREMKLRLRQVFGDVPIEIRVI